MTSTKLPRIATTAICFFTSLLCVLILLIAFYHVIFTQHENVYTADFSHAFILDSFDDHINTSIEDAESAVLSVRKRFWLPDDSTVGPIPNPACYGTADSPAELGWLLEAAEPVLAGQSTLFSTETVIKPGSKVNYYLDESIFAVTWKQIMTNYVFTISEVKVSDASQFRRYLADDTYDSKRLYPTTEMAQKVNAVVGSSADYYRGRKFGIVVHDGKVMRVNMPHKADVCYIDDQGNLIFSYAGDLKDLEAAQKFVDENHIQFSIAFGPIIIDNGERRDPPNYPIGEPNDNYARAALCQRDELHYYVIAANWEGTYTNNQTIHEFTDNLLTLGCQKAYTMDGGNTAAIAMDGKLINRTAFGYQRHLSDIIYFATAIPNQ